MVVATERPALLDGIDADLVAERAAQCRSVARLGSGMFGEVATYLPGRRVLGVRLADGHVEVHVVARWDIPIPEVAAEVRQAVGPLVGGLPINVCVDDVDLPEDGPSDGTTA